MTDPIAVIREVLEFYRRQENTQTANLALAALDQLEANQATIAELVEALEQIEGITSDDFETGGFLCKELPENWRDLAIIKAKEIARTALAKAKGER